MEYFSDLTKQKEFQIQPLHILQKHTYTQNKLKFKTKIKNKNKVKQKLMK